MSNYFSEHHQDGERYVLTHGGLQRAFRLGHPEDTIHLWGTGAFLAKGLDVACVASARDLVEAGEFLIELELVRIEGNVATIRIWAPDQIKIISAKKDPHCQVA